MSLTLYEAASATINRKFALGSRQAISTLTLFAGFASTVFWPLTLTLSVLLGWRDTYASRAIGFPPWNYFVHIPKAPKEVYVKLGKGQNSATAFKPQQMPSDQMGASLIVSNATHQPHMLEVTWISYLYESAQLPRPLPRYELPFEPENMWVCEFPQLEYRVCLHTR